MDVGTHAKYKLRSEIIKALAHPTRLFIVDELSRGPQCVCRLTEMVGADMSTVSKHLAVLNEAGIVSSRKQGQQVFYSLRTPCVLNFLQCVETVLAERTREQLDMIQPQAKGTLVGEGGDAR